MSLADRTHNKIRRLSRSSLPGRRRLSYTTVSYTYPRRIARKIELHVLKNRQKKFGDAEEILRAPSCVQQPQPLLQPLLQLHPHPHPLLPPQPPQQNRMMMRMMIHRQPPPPQLLLQHPMMSTS